MVLSQKDAVEQTRQMIEWRKAEAKRLTKIHAYLRGQQEFDWLPAGVPDEVQRLARMSHVNIMGFVVNAAAQSLYVDGYRSKELDDQPAWSAWQQNRMDRHQIGIHRAALGYGVSYMTVFPGDPTAKMQGVSPRRMTAVYGEDDDWPVWALEKRRSAAKGKLYRLIDDEAVYWVAIEGEYSTQLKYVSTEEHGLGFCPVVRFKETEDLDDEVIGVVQPLMALQDQINVTTFTLLVAQHYGAHRQRYIIGWLAESEQQALTASAQKLWTFDDNPDDVKVGEFGQTDTSNMIESREATLRHVATISQTPVHELLGSIANLSAEALVAARDSHNRSLEEYRTMFGESHEQGLEAVAASDGVPFDPAAWVRWRDMESRSLAQTADALGKLVTMLGVPPEAMWERVPGITQDELERWKTMAAQGGSLEALMRELAAGQTSPDGLGGGNA